MKYDITQPAKKLLRAAGYEISYHQNCSDWTCAHNSHPSGWDELTKYGDDRDPSVWNELAVWDREDWPGTWFRRVETIEEFEENLAFRRKRFENWPSRVRIPARLMAKMEAAK